MNALPNPTNGLNVVSLFDGMSCGRVTIDPCGIIVNHYFASEIENAPIKVSKANCSDITHVGDVSQWQDWQNETFPNILIY